MSYTIQEGLGYPDETAAMRALSKISVNECEEGLKCKQTGAELLKVVTKESCTVLEVLLCFWPIPFFNTRIGRICSILW